MPNTIAIRWRLYPSGWKEYGQYCLHCNARANQWATEDDIRLEHAKTCKTTQKNLEAREGCYSWFNSKYGDHHQIINS